MAIHARPRRVLLISAPLADPMLPNLAIEQLAAIARTAGEACDVFYATLMLPTSVPRTIVHGIAGPAIFAPAYYGLSAEDVAEQTAREVVAQAATYGIDARTAVESVAVDYLMAIDSAHVCLTRCLDAIPIATYDIIGFSVGFDAQKLPSAALGRLLKQREPHVKLLWGGTGCDGDMARAILDVFPDVDAVVQGEAEERFLAMLAALRGERAPATIPHALVRTGAGIVETAGDEPLPALDAVPEADYRDYLAQRAASDYAKRPLVLLFESSRGCWWGRKHHCTFCGIRAVDFAYRRRSPARVVDRVVDLQHAYSPHLLYSTDAILDLEHIRTVLPDLAARRREGLPLRLFYETKSNLRREQIAMLAAAGVSEVQPGIESLSTHVLSLMDKGATALQQVELLKWMQAYDITLIYGLIVGTPGETVADFDAVLQLIPSLHHLPPPLRVNRLSYHKFSRYAAQPDHYGMTDLRPFTVQRLIYRVPDDVLQRLCYELEYSAPAQEFSEMLAARRRLVQAVGAWQADFAAGARMVVSAAGDRLVIARRGPRGELHTWPLTPLEARVYRACERTTAVEHIVRTVGADARAALEHLHAQQLVAIVDGKCLALAVPASVDAWRDAGLDRSSTGTAMSDHRLVPLAVVE